MQFAVQKSSDAGYKQNQLIQKPQIDQELLAQSIQKDALATRQKSSKVDEATNHRIRDEQNNGKNNYLHNEKRKKHHEEDSTAVHHESGAEHPYKGKHIDLSL